MRLPPNVLTLTEPKIAFSETIAPTRLSAAYRCGLIVVAVAMLLLPLLYLALIAVTAWLVWLHVTHDTWILGSGARSRPRRRAGCHARSCCSAAPPSKVRLRPGTSTRWSMR